MKKRTPSHTNFSIDKISEDKLLKKITALVDVVVPNNILGMLATAKDTNRSIIFYNRWELIPHAKHRYDILDLYSKQVLYKNIALFSSALNIIFYLNKPLTRSCPLEKIVYELDQEYYRCFEQIKFYQSKLTSGNKGDIELFSIKLIDRQHKLADIKTRLSKIY